MLYSRSTFVEGGGGVESGLRMVRFGRPSGFPLLGAVSGRLAGAGLVAGDVAGDVAGLLQEALWPWPRPG